MYKFENISGKEITTKNLVFPEGSIKFFAENVWTEENSKTIIELVRQGKLRCLGGNINNISFTKRFLEQVEKKVLIVRDGGIGDIVLLTSAIREYKRLNPNTEIHVQTMYPDVFVHNPDVVYAYRGTEDRKQYNKIFDLSDAVESSRYRTGKITEEESRGVNRTDIFYKWLGIEPNNQDRYVLNVAQDENKEALFLLKEKGYVKGDKLVGYQLLNKTFTRSYGMQKLLKVIQSFEKKQVKFVIFTNDFKYLNTEQQDYFNNNIAVLPNVINFTGKLNLRIYIALLNNCDVILAIDSAIVHIAGALKKKTLSLFGMCLPKLRIKHYKTVKALTPLKGCRFCNNIEDKCRFSRDRKILGLSCVNRISPNRIIKGLQKCIIEHRREAQKKKVSIIIPVYNGYEYTQKCIQSIRQYTKGAYEIIVVDNGSTDKTGRLKDEHKIKYVHYDKPIGFSKANNEGVKRACGEYLLFINNDTEFKEDVIEKLFTGFDDPSVGATGCVGGKIELNSQEGYVFAGATRNSKTFDYLEGWNILVSRDIFDEVGGFTEGYKIAFSEDTDFSFKIKHLGKELRVVKDVKIVHYGSKTVKKQGFFDSDKQSATNRILLTNFWHKKEIIINRQGALGDVLMTTPIIKALKERYPEYRFIYNTSKACADVLRYNPYIDELKYDKNVEGAITLEYELFPAENRIDVMAQQAGVRVADKTPLMYFSKKEQEWLISFLRSLQGKLAVFHTGKSWENREWSIKKFKKVAEWLDKRGYTIIQVGNSSTPLMEGVGKDLRNLSFRQAALLLQKCDLFVGIDSAPAHLAKAAKIPQVIIYGCTDPGVMGNSDKEFPVWLDILKCAGCQQRLPGATFVKCTQKIPYCIKLIPVCMVLDKVREAINE